MMYNSDMYIYIYIWTNDRTVAIDLQPITMEANIIIIYLRTVEMLQM